MSDFTDVPLVQLNADLGDGRVVDSLEIKLAAERAPLPVFISEAYGGRKQVGVVTYLSLRGDTVYATGRLFTDFEFETFAAETVAVPVQPDSDGPHFRATLVAVYVQNPAQEEEPEDPNLAPDDHNLKVRDLIDRLEDAMLYAYSVPSEDDIAGSIKALKEVAAEVLEYSRWLAYDRLEEKNS